MSHVGAGGNWKAFAPGAGGGGCAVGAGGVWKSIEGMWVGEGGDWKRFFIAADRWSDTMTRGSGGSARGFTTDVVFGPFGSLSGTGKFTFVVEFTVIGIFTYSSGDTLRFRLSGGTQAQRAAAWSSLICSLGVFDRADATETDNGGHSHYEWSNPGGQFPGSGTETVGLLS